MRLEAKAPSAGAAAGAARDLDPRTQMRMRREQLLKGSTRTFVLPGYDVDNEELGGWQIVARYRRLGFKKLQEIFTTSAVAEDVVAVNVQFLVEACEEIFYRDHDGLHPLVSGHKTRYTVNLETSESLGTFLGVDHLPSMREQLVAAFGENELAVNDHSGDVHRWMISLNADDGQTAVGES